VISSVAARPKVPPPRGFFHAISWCALVFVDFIIALIRWGFHGVYRGQGAEAQIRTLSNRAPTLPFMARSSLAVLLLLAALAGVLPGTSSTRTTRTRNSRLRQRFCPGMAPSAPVISPCLAAFSMQFWGRIFDSG